MAIRRARVVSIRWLTYQTLLCQSAAFSLEANIAEKKTPHISFTKNMPCLLFTKMENLTNLAALQYFFSFAFFKKSYEQRNQKLSICVHVHVST